MVSRIISVTGIRTLERDGTIGAIATSSKPMTDTAPGVATPLSQLPDGANRHIVVTRHQRGKRFAAGEQLRDRRRAASLHFLRRSARHELQSRAAPARPCSRKDAPPRWGIQRTGDKRNLPVAFRDQLRYRVLTRRFMIGPDAVAAVFPQTAVEHHNRLLAFLNNFVQRFHAQKTRVDDYRVAAHVEQVLDRLALLFGAVLAVRRIS